MSRQCQSDITIKVADGEWRNICYVYEKGDKTPHFDLNGIVWNKFRYEVKGELLRKVAIVG